MNSSVRLSFSAAFLNHKNMSQPNQKKLQDAYNRNPPIITWRANPVVFRLFLTNKQGYQRIFWLNLGFQICDKISMRLVNARCQFYIPELLDFGFLKTPILSLLPKQLSSFNPRHCVLKLIELALSRVELQIMPLFK